MKLFQSVPQNKTMQKMTENDSLLLDAMRYRKLRALAVHENALEHYVIAGRWDHLPSVGHFDAALDAVVLLKQE